MRSVLLLSLFSDVSCMYFVSLRRGLMIGRVGLKTSFSMSCNACSMPFVKST